MRGEASGVNGDKADVESGPLPSPFAIYPLPFIN